MRELSHSTSKRFQHTATRRWLRCTAAMAAVLPVFQHTATRRWLQENLEHNLSFFVFQHTATRRWLPSTVSTSISAIRVSTHSHPKVAAAFEQLAHLARAVSTHSHPKVAAVAHQFDSICQAVSTHSHPKVAASGRCARAGGVRRFNTQPPEGGCCLNLFAQLILCTFQHTATRRWLLNGFVYASCYGCVSTHSHPKVAAHRGRKHKNHQATFQHTATRRWLPGALRCMQSFAPSFNTQPPEGGCTIAQSFNWAVDVSTHSHPKVAAARLPPRLMYSVAVSTHSHPKVAAVIQVGVNQTVVVFQHTATRRWLR